MKQDFSSRLKVYLQEHHITCYRFGKMLTQVSKQNTGSTAEKVARWLRGKQPRLATFEGALALKIIQDWEKSKGIKPPIPQGNTHYLENEKHYYLDDYRKNKIPLSYSGKRKIVDTYLKSGRPFSYVLSPRHEKFIRLYFGLNKSHTRLSAVEIAHQYQLNIPQVWVLLFVGLRRLKYCLPAEIGVNARSYTKEKEFLEKYLKSGGSLSSVLKKKQEPILRLRYGLDGQNPMSLQAIGNRFGLTREAVRVSIISSLKKLK